MHPNKLRDKPSPNSKRHIVITYHGNTGETSVTEYEEMPIVSVRLNDGRTMWLEDYLEMERDLERLDSPSAKSGSGDPWNCEGDVPTILPKSAHGE